LEVTGDISHNILRKDLEGVMEGRGHEPVVQTFKRFSSLVNLFFPNKQRAMIRKAMI